MKRLIKYWNQYASDKHGFSDCSTKYEILPELVSDDASGKELKALAKKHGIKVNPKVFLQDDSRRSWRRSLQITHAVKSKETKTRDRFGNKEVMQVYLGFITLPESGPLKPISSIENPIDKALAWEIVNKQCYGVSDCGEHIDGQMIIVKEGWNYYHEIKLLGYSLESFEKVLEAEDYGFSDDTESCDQCGKFNSQDNGYTYNFRYIESEGNLGVNCGCFDKFCKSDSAIEHYADNASECMELDSAKSLARRGKLRFLERFIGGMTDGRGGYFDGKPTREGHPKEVLKEFQEKFPSKRFLFTRDGSGQFQTYFSIWEITARGCRARRNRKAA